MATGPLDILTANVGSNDINILGATDELPSSSHSFPVSAADLALSAM
jgi:hypothetical protein